MEGPVSCGNPASVVVLIVWCCDGGRGDGVIQDSWRVFPVLRRAAPCFRLPVADRGRRFPGDPKEAGCGSCGVAPVRCFGARDARAVEDRVRRTQHGGPSHQVHRAEDRGGSSNVARDQPG